MNGPIQIIPIRSVTGDIIMRTVPGGRQTDVILSNTTTSTFVCTSSDAGLFMLNASTMTVSDWARPVPSFGPIVF